MTAPEHSPLPWTSDRYDRILDADGNYIGAVNGRGILVDEQNARLIITAVNSHAALIVAAKAAKEAVELIELWHNMGIPNKGEHWNHYQESPEMQRINAAIAAAEELQ